MDDKKINMIPFFNGPFNPKYKDLNLYNKEYNLSIKNFYNITNERNIDRIKQKNVIKIFKILELGLRPKFILNKKIDI